MISKLKKLTQGFTLIETLVAVLILATAIAGPLSIASRGLTTALVAKDQIVAYYLAQDAVEYIRFARDTNTLAAGDWLTGAGGGATVINLSSCVSTDGCNVDSAANTVTACTGATCTNTGIMKFNSTTKTYNTTGTLLPSFTRIIKITGSGDERQIDVMVSWSDTGSIVRSVNVVESILNWQ